MNMEFDATQEQSVQEQAPVVVAQEEVQVRPDASDWIYGATRYQEWLSNQPRQIGPFGVFWNAEEGQALVKQFCEERGWS